MTLRVCANPGCPELSNQTRCERCRKAKRRREDARRPSAKARGYGPEHEADRKAYFKLHPLCQEESGCIKRATDLDHIDGNPFNRDWSNYRGLCSPHHKQRTARDQPGGWNA